MAKLKIVTGEDNKILRTVCKPVQKFDAKLKKFAKDLKQTMEAANGLGIAAPQVGETIRVFIATMNVNAKDERQVLMVNPTVTLVGSKIVTDEEGCLSLPGIFGKVPRHDRVEVEFFGVDGARQCLKLKGLNARVVQHENDHINGILFLDRMKKGVAGENLLI